MSDPTEGTQRLAAYKRSYVDLFGKMPEVPGKRFDDLAELSPEFVASFENLRAIGFYSDVFDV